MSPTDTSSAPGVSFVVAVRNQAPALPGLLASIRAQAGDFPRQYVFVDDGSTDDTLQSLIALTEGWPNSIIEDLPHGGPGVATNRGLALADQPLVKLVAPDGLLAHDATDRLRTALLASEAGLAFGDAGATDPSAPLPAAPRVKRLKSPLKRVIKDLVLDPTQLLAPTETVRAAGGCDERPGTDPAYSLSLRLAAEGDFLHLLAPVAQTQSVAPDTRSPASAPRLHSLALTLAGFLRDNPLLPERLQVYACRRAAGQAWNFARRHIGARAGSEWYLLSVKSGLDLMGPAGEFVERCAEAYERVGAAGAGDG